MILKSTSHRQKYGNVGRPLIPLWRIWFPRGGNSSSTVREELRVLEKVEPGEYRLSSKADDSSWTKMQNKKG